MKYTAKPVVVDASIIVEVSEVRPDGSMRLTLQDGSVERANGPMISRFIPAAGDYFVVQGDGYRYVNPKDVFERKYGPSEETSAGG